MIEVSWVKYLQVHTHTNDLNVYSTARLMNSLVILKSKRKNKQTTINLIIYSMYSLKIQQQPLVESKKQKNKQTSPADRTRLSC